jgi:hypothetical protein
MTTLGTQFARPNGTNRGKMVFRTPLRSCKLSFCRARTFAVLMLEAAYIHHAIALGDLRKVQKEIPE